MSRSKEEEAARGRVYRAAHPERVAARKRAYREANREEIADKQRAYRAAHPEEKAAKAAYDRTYRAAHREDEAARGSAWRKANREKVAAQKRAWCEAHPEKVAAQAARRRARKAEVRPGGLPLRDVQRPVGCGVVTEIVVNHPGERRQRLAREAAVLRGAGLLQREIMEALGISQTYVSELLRDPSGTVGKQRKERYRQPCVDCGAPTSGSDGRRAEPRCIPCASARSGASLMVWTPGRVIEAIQEWARIYGEPPSSDDWNPWAARNDLHDEERARRWERAGVRVKFVLDCRGCLAV